MNSPKNEICQVKINNEDYKIEISSDLNEKTKNYNKSTLYLSLILAALAVLSILSVPKDIYFSELAMANVHYFIFAFTLSILFLLDKDILTINKILLLSILLILQIVIFRTSTLDNVIKSIEQKKRIEKLESDVEALKAKVEKEIDRRKQIGH